MLLKNINKCWKTGSEPPVTISECFANCVQKYSKNTALSVKRNQKWISWTYK